MASHLESPKIPWHLILVFFLLAISIGITGYKHYEYQKENLKADKVNELSVIAEMKAGQIAEWRQERKGEAEIIRENPFMAHQVQQLLENSTAPGLEQDILTWMASLKKHNQCESVHLLDGQGTVRLSFPVKDEVLGSNAKALAAEAISTKKVVFSDLYISATANATRLSLLVPLLVQQGHDTIVAGVLLLRLDPYQFLYPLIQSWPTPSQTAESILIRREGDEVVYLNELRHRKDTALSLRLPASNRQLPEAIAVSGKEGIVEGLDYRGEPVLAAVRQIPDSPWFLVAKVDAKEVYGTTRERAWYTAILAGALILLAGVTTVFFWRLQQIQFYRKRYEMELERRALSRHYEYLTKYANDIILLFDQNFKVIEVNDRAVTSYGYTREEFLQMTQADIEEQVKKMEELDGVVYETVHYRKDGTTFPVEVSSRLIEVEGVKFYQAIIRDITERKRMEDALRHSEEYFRSLIENALDIITILGSDGTIRYKSPSVKRVLGYEPEELIGKNAFDFIHPEDVPNAGNVFTEVIQTPFVPRSAELRFRHEDGSWRILEVVGKNLLDNPAVAGVVVNNHDITERKQAEEKIKKLNEDLERRVIERTAQLEASNKELEAFSYSVSHDLQAPLRSIDGFSQALLEDYYNKLDAQGKDYLQRIRAATQRMGQLIDNLLSLSRVTRSEMRREKVDLSALAQTIAAELRKTQPERQVDFVIAQGPFANGDARLLRIVLENLMGNAWKFTGKHPRARIEFGVTERDGKPVYFVRDDGAGFDMTYAEKLFGAFQRLHGMTEFPGTGIGLATVQRIIHRHGGRVWAEGAVGQGATFYFTL